MKVEFKNGWIVQEALKNLRWEKKFNLKVKKVELNNIQSILLQEIKEKFMERTSVVFSPIKYYILSVNSKKRVI